MATSTVIKLHFGLLLFLVLHFFLQNAYGFGLNTTLLFGIKLVIYVSGTVLFFSFFKKKSWVRYYASLYVFSPVVVFLGYLLDGILGAILGSVFFLFLYLPTSVISDKNYTVKTEYAGLLSPCCAYALYESRTWIFEKKVTRFMADASKQDFQQLIINPARTRALVYYKNEQNRTEMVDVLLPSH